MTSICTFFVLCVWTYDIIIFVILNSSFCWGIYLFSSVERRFPKRKESHFFSGLVDTTILDRIKWNSKPPSLQIKDEAARKPKWAIFPSLILEKVGYCSYYLPKGQAVKLTFFALWALNSVFTQGPSRYISELSVNHVH